MELKDLTREELMLIQTDFGEELQKTAAAYVDNIEAESEEAVKTASACEQMGFEMATKLAAEMEENYTEKKKEPKKDEEKSEEEKKEEIIQKEASVRAAIMFESTIAGLEKLGEERYGDKNIYLEEMVKQSGVADKIKNLLAAAKTHFKSVGSKASQGAKTFREGASTAGRGVRKNIKYHMAAGGKKMLEGAKGMGPAAAYAGGALAGGYGLKKLTDKK